MNETNKIAVIHVVSPLRPVSGIIMRLVELSGWADPTRVAAVSRADVGWGWANVAPQFASAGGNTGARAAAFRRAADRRSAWGRATR